MVTWSVEDDYYETIKEMCRLERIRLEHICKEFLKSRKFNVNSLANLLDDYAVECRLRSLTS